jgi:hypothetical protein
MARLVRFFEDHGLAAGHTEAVILAWTAILCGGIFVVVSAAMLL